MRHIYKGLRLLCSVSNTTGRQRAKNYHFSYFSLSIFLIVNSLLIDAPLQAQSFPATISQLPKGKKITITYKATINKPLNPRTRLTVADQAILSADGLNPVWSDDPATPVALDSTLTSVLGCTLLTITADSISCGLNNLYNVKVTVKNDGGAPTMGNLVIEAGGQSFTAAVKVGDTLQSMVISLPANGQFVKIKAFYSDLPECTLTKDSLFTAPVGCGIIGNRVWEDLNGNGIQEAGENGIPNVSVALLNCSGSSIAQTSTNASGLYQFANLPAGSYKVRFDLATAGATFSTGIFTIKGVGADTLNSDVDPTTKETACLTLAAGQQIESVDAGVYVPAQIGNFAFVDRNKNNYFDAGDTPLQGVPVKLYRCSETTPIATQTTNASGNYLFTGLVPGSYKVEFGFPATGIYERVTINIATDNVDSDANANGFTDCYTVQSQKQELTVDVGYTFCPPATNLACIANVNLTMNETCALKVTPDMILSTLPSCASTFEVRIAAGNNPPFGDVVTGQYVGQTLRVVVIDKQTDNFCSSNIVVRDVTKPVLNCPPNTNKAVYSQQVQIISGTLSTLSNSANLATFSCFNPVINPGGGNHYYDIYTFTVSKADVFTFELSPQFGEGAALLYEGNPNFQNLCEGVFAQSYKSFTNGIYFNTLNPILRLTARLQPGKTYTLLTTSRTPAVTGAYFWAAYSDGDGLINNLNPISTQASYDLICTDISQILNKSQSLAFVGIPQATDNCSVPTTNITFVDVLSDGGDCNGNIITRTFTAKDPSGNAAQCTQIISVRKPTLADVVYPNLTAYLECDASFPVDSKGNPSPSVTGYPFIKTTFGNYDLSVNYCNIAATYQDKPRAVGCSGTYTLIREWMITDLCNSFNSLIFNQFIRVGDSEVPVVECPSTDTDGDGVIDTLVFSTTSFNCFANFEVPAPIITDNCSSSTFQAEVISDTLMQIFDQFGFLIDTRLEKFVRATVESTGALRVNNIPIGDHTLRYTVTDACGNVSKLDCPFKIKDLSEPIMVCKSSLTVSLGGSGTTEVFARDVDEGSRDNCAIDSILIRRKYTRDPITCDTLVGAAVYYSEWDTVVTIGCCDANAKVEVELKVVDKAGNANECNSQIEVLDKIKPFCVAPPAMSIPCTSLPKDFNPNDTLTLQSLFGVASASDNCGATWQELEPNVNLQDCSFGTITRRFRTVDRVGNISINTCQQVITITKVNNYEIKFPKDTDMQCGVSNADTLKINRLACDKMSISVTDERFSALGAECYRIFRTYRIINACEYDGISQPIVIGRDEDCDNNAGDEDVWLVRRPNNTFVDRNDVETDNIPAANQRGCTPTNPRGYWRTSNTVGFWQYTQVIRVFDTIPPEIIFVPPTPFCATTDNCNTLVKVPFVISEACTPGTVTTEITVDLNADGTSNGTLASLGGTLIGIYPNFEISGTFAKGKHIFQVKAKDGCNNERTQKISFEVVDCKAPTFNCSSSFSIVLTPVRPPVDVNGDNVEDRGTALVKVSNFINGNVTDCSGPVRYSLSRVGEMPVIGKDSLRVTCTDLTAPIYVKIYAWDSASNPYSIQPNGTVGGPNYNSCEAYIIVQDTTFKACAPPKKGLITGNIRTEDNDPVEAALVSLSGQSAATTYSAVDGNYSFSLLDEGYDYTLAPLLDTNYINGVSTIDLIIITKHILGVQLLTSPYKMIAADVNNSKTISTLDLIQMRKLILGIDVAFGSNTSWRFVDANYNFPVQTNPWFQEYPEVLSINDLNGTLSNANFIGIKIGDVNLNASTTRSAINIENRNRPKTFPLEVENRLLRAGETYPVAFYGMLADIQGYQGTFAFNSNNLELIDVDYNIIKSENFGWKALEKGFITTSWNQMDVPLNNEKTYLFSLVFRAKADGQLSDMLHLNSRSTKAEAYDLHNNIMDLAIHFTETKHLPDQIELYQNTPNPFSNLTTIGFYLPQAADATLKISDTSGKLLKTITNHYNTGYHQVILQKSDLPTSGVLYYTLETGQQVVTRKMIRLD